MPLSHYMVWGERLAEGQEEEFGEKEENRHRSRGEKTCVDRGREGERPVYIWR